ncbi:MAG: right-handed parallel beta-helix repeat-containing protein [Eubacterium sp.]|nr:right-handed parallel beta-helix repeat-containing protein [Eubacterium sp.]
MKKVLSLILAVMFLFMTGITAYADEQENIVETIVVDITQEELAQNDPADVIDGALDKARLTDMIDLTVNVPSGTYKLSRGLHIYSNTKLNLQPDTEFIRNFEDGSLLRTGHYKDINYAYDGYKNIVVTGGIWNNNYKQQSCAMRLMHCENIVYRNFTVKNVYDSHHIEVGAARNVTFDGLTITGYKRSKNTSGEGIQIDPIHSEEHFKSTIYMDDTPCSDITVKNCTFDGLFAGVGTRSAVIGSYFYNMHIENNTFNNISNKAISTFNYINSTIKNNTINNASVGIFVELYPTKNLTSVLWMPFENASAAQIQTNVNTEISGNTINVKKVSSYAQSCGIGVYGGVMSADTANRTGLKSGSYLANNLRVNDNTVNISTANSCGMEFKYVNNSSVYNNKINGKVKASGSNCGMLFKNANKNKIFNNNVNGKLASGIMLTSYSKNNELSWNKVRNAQYFGLNVNGTSTATIYVSNSFSGNGKGAIYLKDKTFTIPKIKGKLKVKRTKSKTTVSWKKVKNVKGYIIYRSAKKNGTYKEYKRVGAKKVSITVKGKKKYYYKVVPYRKYNKTTIYGKKTGA